MFDMSWGEVMVIGAVALIVIGPKDLPKALRTVGQVTGKVRKLAGEFQTQFNEAMREADLEDARRQVEGINRQVSSFNPVQTIRDELKGAVDGRTAASTTAAPATEPVLPALPDAVPAIDLPPPLPPADAASPLPRDVEPAATPVEAPGAPAVDPASPQPRDKAGLAAP